MTDKNIKAIAARDALDSVEEMQKKSFRRAAPPRWFGMGISLIVAVGFSLYALEDPGSSPGLFIALGIALFVGLSRDKLTVIAKVMPNNKAGFWAIAGIIAFLLALFFGGIFVRRAYDLAWVPLVTGLIAGTTIYLLNESERRYYRSKSDNGAH